MRGARRADAGDADADARVVPKREMPEWTGRRGGVGTERGVEVLRGTGGWS